MPSATTPGIFAELDAKDRKALLRKLSLLDEKTFDKVWKSATAKAMTPISKEARSNARRFKDQGVLAKSIGKKTKAFKKDRTTWATVGARKHYSQVVNVELPEFLQKIFGKQTVRVKRVPKNYQHLVEFGTSSHEQPGIAAFLKRSVFRHPGAKKQPFLRPAFDRKRGAAVEAFRKAIRQNLEKLARRL